MKFALAESYQRGLARFGAATAERTYLRILSHTEEFLAVYPRTGRWCSSIACFQTWIPGTPFVVFYRVRNDVLEVVGLFHHAQDTSDFDPGPQ